MQAFRIKVEPDVQEQPMSMDISSVVSKPITVLSKRINKPKGKRAPMSGSIKRAPGKRVGGVYGSGWDGSWPSCKIANAVLLFITGDHSK